MGVNIKNKELFFKLHCSLLFYVNEKKKVVEDIASPEQLRVEGKEDLLTLRNIIVKEPSLLNAFVKENPFRFKEQEIKIVEEWKNVQVTHEFYSEKT